MNTNEATSEGEYLNKPGYTLHRQNATYHNEWRNSGPHKEREQDAGPLRILSIFQLLFYFVVVSPLMFFSGSIVNARPA